MTQRPDLMAPRGETCPAQRRGMVLAAATLGFGVIQLDVSVVNVALILSAGALGDRSGHKRLMMAGFAVFTLASAACGLVPATGELIAARAVQGAGAAALGASSLSLINHTYPDTAGRARAVSVWTAGGAATLAAGPLIGGVLIATVGWRSIFFINLPLGALGWWLTRRYATETPAAPGRRADLPGQVSAGLLVNLIFFGLIFAFSLFLQRQQGLSPLATGLTFLPVTALIVVSNLVAGRVLPARGTRAIAWAGGAAHGSRLPGHARPGSRTGRPTGPDADRGPVADRVRHRPGRHRRRLRPARQRGPGSVRDRVRHLHRLPADRQRPRRRPVRHPCSPASARQLALRLPSRSAPASSPSSPCSATPPPDHLTRPTSESQNR